MDCLNCLRTGSIPAHAGEPWDTGGWSRDAGVYPRPRGGTDGATMTAVAAEGLSPPTRGNPDDERSTLADARSIPAHAGEPRADARQQAG